MHNTHTDTQIHTYKYKRVNGQLVTEGEEGMDRA